MEDWQIVELYWQRQSAAMSDIDGRHIIEAGQAHAEWCRFREEYVGSHEFENYDDLGWLGGNEELESYYYICWAYDTACGEQVYITNAGTEEYPAFDYCTILYETDNAYVIVLGPGGPSEAYYLELLADSIDFTKFK